MSCWVWVLRGLGQSAEIVSPVNYGPLNLECLSFLYLCVCVCVCVCVCTRAPFYYFLRNFTFFISIFFVVYLIFTCTCIYSFSILSPCTLALNAT